jgi:excisionase family DNA binding protein
LRYSEQHRFALLKSNSATTQYLLKEEFTHMLDHAYAPADALSNSATLLTKEQVSKLLQVSPRYIERQVKLGKLRALKFSSRLLRFRLADVNSFSEGFASAFFVAPKARKGTRS